MQLYADQTARRTRQVIADVLALASIVLMVVALRLRLRNETSCRVPA